MENTTAKSKTTAPRAYVQLERASRAVEFVPKPSQGEEK